MPTYTGQRIEHPTFEVGKTNGFPAPPIPFTIVL